MDSILVGALFQKWSSVFHFAGVLTRVNKVVLAQSSISYFNEFLAPLVTVMNLVSTLESHTGIQPWDQSSRFSPLLQTTDQQTLERFFCHYQVPKAFDLQMKFGTNLDADFRSFEFADLQVSAVRYGTEVSTSFSVDAVGIDKPWRFFYILGGESVGRRVNLRTKQGDAAVFRIGGSADYLLSSDFSALMLTVPGNAMSQAYRALHGNNDRFDQELSMSVTSGSAAAMTLLRSITRLAETPKYDHHAALRLERGIKEAVLLEILMNWPGATLPTIQESLLPASTRLARDFIHAHIKDLPTVSDVAASCRIGVRALDRGFKRHLGVSPLQYMLDLRLQGVHDDLIANRNGHTVTDVAIYWGFSNLGIFAARYRERFGELPSKTLLQSRQLPHRLN